MALLQDLAFQIVKDQIGATFEDKIEAYQFINDNWLVDRLPGVLQEEYNMLIETGIIDTAPWRTWYDL